MACGQELWTCDPSLAVRSCWERLGQSTRVSTSVRAVTRWHMAGRPLTSSYRTFPSRPHTARPQATGAARANDILKGTCTKRENTKMTATKYHSRKTSLVSLPALSTASSGLQEQVSGDVPTRAWAKERIRHPRSRCAAMGQWRESVKLTFNGARDRCEGDSGRPPAARNGGPPRRSLLLERQRLHFAVEAHVRDVPVASAVQLLDARRVHLGDRLVVEHEPRLRVALDPRNIVAALGRPPLMRDDAKQLVLAGPVVALERVDGADARGLSVDLLDRLRAVRLAGGARALRLHRRWLGRLGGERRGAG
mmetsp:Transcript_605/g.1969  ORF Transcript_605/g.1969 Transcript_605/m.1969 type:complete len:308 (+) Transcript_605:755-1678(+)